MINSDDIKSVITTHASNTVKDVLLKDIDGLEPIDAFIIIRGRAVSCKNSDDDEKTNALASLIGVSEDRDAAIEDLTTGVKYINKYWSK